MRQLIKTTSIVIFWVALLSIITNALLMLVLAYFGKLYWLPLDPLKPVQPTIPDSNVVLISRNTYIDGHAKTINGTGTFIGKNIILTAAHVTTDLTAENDDTQEWVIRTNWNQSINDKQSTNPKAHVYTINAKTTDVHVHYYGNRNKHAYALSSVPQNDLALIILPKTIDANTLNATVAPIAYQKHLTKASYTGYPFEDLPKTKEGTAFKSEGLIEPTLWNNQNIVIMSSRTYQGMSGSGVKNQKGQIVGLLSMSAYMEPIVPKENRTSAILQFDQKQIHWMTDQLKQYGAP